MTERNETENRKRKHIQIEEPEDNDSDDEGISLVSEEIDEDDDEMGRPPSRNSRDSSESSEQTNTSVQDTTQDRRPSPPGDSDGPKHGSDFETYGPETTHEALCFVINNWTESHKKAIEKYCKRAPTSYVIYQHEVGDETGTPHLQGFIYNPNKIKWRIAIEVFIAPKKLRNPSFQCQINYCTKSKTRDITYPDFVEHNPKNRPVDKKDPKQQGSQGKKGGQQGKEAEIERWKNIREACKGTTYSKFCDEYPDIGAKYSNAIKEWINEYNTREIEKGWDLDFIEDNADVEWTKPFELHVDKHISDNLEKWVPRKICWVAEYHGGIGKTTYAQHLRITHPELVQILEPSDFKNMAYLIDEKKKIFIVDCPMSALKGDGMYHTLESLKNGKIQSTKYLPNPKTIRRPIVIVFSNSLPDHGAMSAGRYDLFDTQNPPSVEPSAGVKK